MIQAAFDRALVMERVVRTLLVADGAPDYGQQVELAKERYDDSTPFLGSLLKHLEDQPEDLRALEAVVVLGAACPGAAARHGVEPIEVGRALAPRLIAAGQTLRAERLFEFLCRARPNDERLEHAWNSALRRSGNVDAQVDRYLQLSETEAAEGRPEEAISWLRKALLLDSSRRDIARTIRDLRRTGGQRLQVRLLGRRVIVGVVLAGLVAVAVRHERKARREYASLPQASAGDLGGLEQRLAGLDRMVPGSRIWLGMFDARREQLAVRIQLECLLEAQQAELAIQQDEERAGRLAQANAAQRQARELVSRGSYDEAIEAYALALELAPPDWEHTDRARKDLEAVRVRRAQLEP